MSENNQYACGTDPCEYDSKQNKTRFFTGYQEKWEKQLDGCEVLKDICSVETVENAIVLPLKKIERAKIVGKGALSGGVCDENYKFIAGSQKVWPCPPPEKHNRSCLSAYIPEKVVFRDETVIFGGILNEHFGHMLLDSLSRMWYFAKNQHSYYKYVFILMTNETSFVKGFFEIADLLPDQYEIITEPTKFSKMIIPSETMFEISGCASREFLDFFDFLKEKVKQKLPPSNYEKVYLTRSQLKSDACVNEVWYEEYFSKEGYQIISPEKYSLAEQINFMIYAKEIACTIGTLSHLVLFAQDNVALKVLLREPTSVLKAQIIINKLRNVRCDYIEATFNMLPITHYNGVSFFGPTEWFAEYVRQEKCTAPEFLFGRDYLEHNGDLVVRYLYTYAEHYAVPGNFARIAKRNSIDYIYDLNYGLLGNKIPKPSAKSNAKNATDPQKKIAKLEAEIKSMKKSASWKITKPLRMIADKLRKLKKKVKL